MATVFDSIIKLGTSVSQIFNNDMAVYVLYFIVSLYGYFIIYQGLFQFIFRKHEAFKGKRANFIAFCFTVITVGAIFYDETPKTLVTTYNTVFNFLMSILIVIIPAGFATFATFKFFKRKSIKLFVASTGAWFILNVLNKGLAKLSTVGATDIGPLILSMTVPLENFLVLAMWIGLISMIIGALEFFNGIRGPKSLIRGEERSKNIDSMIGLLGDLREKSNNVEDLFKQMNQLLNSATNVKLSNNIRTNKENEIKND